MYQKCENIINIHDQLKGIKYSNYIIGVIYIPEKDIYEDIKIINDTIGNAYFPI